MHRTEGPAKAQPCPWLPPALPFPSRRPTLPLGLALVLKLLLLGVFAGFGTILSGPAADWMRNAPATWEVGAAVAGMTRAFGLPGWPLWGVVALCLNYIPIPGPSAGVALFALIGLAALGASWLSLLPAAAYLGIHILEGEIITPMILARRFTINPIAVMVGLVFWYWMWGVQGAFHGHAAHPAWRRRM